MVGCLTAHGVITEEPNRGYYPKSRHIEPKVRTKVQTEEAEKEKIQGGKSINGEERATQHDDNHDVDME